MTGSYAWHAKGRFQPSQTIDRARKRLGTEDYRDRYQRLTGRSLRDCPLCGKGHMVCIETFLPGALPRAPPHMHHGH